MDDRGDLHLIEADLAEAWIKDFAADGVRSLEAYLAKHLAFLLYLDDGSSV